MAAAILATPVTSAAQRYSAEQQGEVVTLTDRGTDTVVSVVPAVGNIATEMRVKGHNVLRFPHASLADFKARPGATGIPFMGPWANRLDEQAFYANGKRHAFDMTLGNVRGEVPIHGFVTTTTLWRVTSLGATESGAAVTSRLDFHQQPDWMRQWPFAHTIEITYRLSEGVLEVATAIANLGAEPCRCRWGSTRIQLTDSPATSGRSPWGRAPAGSSTRERCRRARPSRRTACCRAARGVARLQPRRGVQQSGRRCPGPGDDDGVGREAAARRRAGPALPLGGRLGAEPLGSRPRRARRFTAAERNFICFEPMAAISNALNMAHRGQYKELQSIAPGETWRESFWVKPSGFITP